MSDKIMRAIKQPVSAPIPTVEATDKAAPRFIGSGPAQISATFELEYPLEWMGTAYHSVELHRLKGKDFSRMRRLTMSGIGEDEAMLHVISGLPIEVIQELDADDYFRLLESSAGFIPGRFRETAESGPDSESGQDMPAS